MTPMRPNLSKQTRTMALHGTRIRGRPLAALLMLVIAMAATMMVWGGYAHAAPHKGRSPGRLETCAAAANCSAPIHGEDVDVGMDHVPEIPDVILSAATQYEQQYSASQEDDVDVPDVVVWNATMTVGESDIASIGYLGFITGDWPDTGSIDDVSFSHDGVDYLVTALYHPIVDGNPNHLFMHLDMPLPEGWTLLVGPDLFELADAQAWGPRRNIYHWYLEESLGWADGDRVKLSLSAPGSPDEISEDALVKKLPPGTG